MKKIKHSKYKNTGILFELLVRQITLEVLNNSDKANAQRILKEFFGKKTELAKELRLYNLLLKEKYNSENRAEKFIDLVCEEHTTKIDVKKLNKEKYNLVSEIKDSFDMDQFFSSTIRNYREFASVYKLFESKREKNFDIKDIFNSKYTLVEHVMNDSVKHKEKKIENKVIKEYKSQQKDLRLLAYKILVENFNKKYTKLNESQKTLLKKYINNVSNTTNFKEYVEGEVLPNIISELRSLNSNIDDKVTNIKLNETIKVLKKIKPGRDVSDSHVTSIMLAYELVKEIKSKVKK